MLRDATLVNAYAANTLSSHAIELGAQCDRGTHKSGGKQTPHPCKCLCRGSGAPGREESGIFNPPSPITHGLGSCWLQAHWPAGSVLDLNSLGSSPSRSGRGVGAESTLCGIGSGISHAFLIGGVFTIGLNLTAPDKKTKMSCCVIIVFTKDINPSPLSLKGILLH